MSIERIVKFLEIAKDYRERYPELSLDYAIGLTVIDNRDVTEWYAALLEGHDVSNKWPGGEISREVYEDICGRYDTMQQNLKTVLGYKLDSSDPEALPRMIEVLRRLLPFF